jgi:1-deoxy-D-xylulose-5-phosphate reductoisomerase
MNAANEAANQAFRDGKIPFLMIEDIVIEAVHSCTFRELETVQDLIDADAWGREFAMAKIRSCQS